MAHCQNIGTEGSYLSLNNHYIEGTEKPLRTSFDPLLCLKRGTGVTVTPLVTPRTPDDVFVFVVKGQHVIDRYLVHRNHCNGLCQDERGLWSYSFDVELNVGNLNDHPF